MATWRTCCLLFVPLHYCACGVHATPHSHECDPPLLAGDVGRDLEERQTDQGDGRGDGQRPDVAQGEADHPAEAEKGVNHRGDDDGALDLKKKKKKTILI